MPTTLPPVPWARLADAAVGYEGKPVLAGLTFALPRGRFTAVVGENGSGKTTLLKTLAGEIRPMSGEIVFDGKNAEKEPTERRARRGIGYVPQEHAVFGKMTVRENLALGAVAQRGASRIDYVLDFFPKLAQRLDQTAATLSGGERKMLAISRALLGNPKLLMLDEPTEGVWIGVIEEIADRLLQLSKGITLILVEQHVELALRLADYVYVMDRGGFALQGTAAEIRDDPRLLRYLAP